MEPNNKGDEMYYMGDRVYYQPPPATDSEGPTHVVVQQKKVRDMGCCMWIATALFIVLIVFLVICLILFFTWDRNPKVSSSSTFKSSLLSHQDQVSSREVLTNLKTNAKMCLLGAAYFDDNYLALFNGEHIPTARHFDIERVITKTGTKRRNLKHPLEFQTYVRSLGIDSNCHIVIYDHGEAADAIKAATYVWWLFKVYGHDQVSVMDGGLRAWKSNEASEFQVTSDLAAPVPDGNFKAKWDPRFIVTFPDVLANFDKPKYQLLDSRSEEQFNGGNAHKLAAGGGRIKGAINIPTSDLLDEQGALKSKEEIKDIVDQKLSNQPCIVYCNTAMQASTVFFALQQLGIEAVLYDGSWVEWSYLAPPDKKEVILSPSA